jgi:uncharacterized membrane protein
MVERTSAHTAHKTYFFHAAEVLAQLEHGRLADLAAAADVELRLIMATRDTHTQQ